MNTILFAKWKCGDKSMKNEDLCFIEVNERCEPSKAKYTYAFTVVEGYRLVIIIDRGFSFGCRSVVNSIDKIAEDIGCDDILYCHRMGWGYAKIINGIPFFEYIGGRNKDLEYALVSVKNAPLNTVL